MRANNEEEGRTPEEERDPYRISRGGMHLVEASAGTGKTTLLSFLFLKAVVVWGIPVDRIAVVTFTRAATQELLVRIRRDLSGLLSCLETPSNGSSDGFGPIGPIRDLLTGVSPEEALSRISRAMVDFDRVVIRTIHSFYQGILTDLSPMLSLPDETEIVGRTEPILFEAIVRTLRHEMDLLDPALRSLMTRKGITNLQFYNGAISLLPRPDPETLLPRIVSLVAGGWPESTLDERQGPSDTRLRAVYETVLERREAVLDVLSGDPRPELQTWLREPDFPVSVLCLSQENQKGFFSLLKTSKRDKSETVRAFKELGQAMEDLSSLWDEASKALIRRLLHGARIQLEQMKKEQRIAFQDDALAHLLGALLEEERRFPGRKDEWRLHREIRRRYDLLLVDEFQDTDPDQIALLWRVGLEDPDGSLGEGPTMVFVGDPKQSIYRFRGADLNSYLAFRKRLSTPPFALTTSYRQSEELVTSLNVLYASHPSPFANPGILAPAISWGSSRTGALMIGEERVAPFRIWVRDNPESDDPDVSIARETAREIVRFLSGGAAVSSGPVPESGIAVLVRTGRQGQQVAGELGRLGVPVQIELDGSVFNTPQARDLEWILLAILGRGGLSGIVAALSCDLVGTDRERLQAIIDDAEQREEVLLLFSRLRKEWDRSGVFQMGALLIERLSIRSRLQQRINGERESINLDHLLELLHQWENAEQLVAERLLFRFSRAIRRSVDLPVRDEELLRMSGAKNAVRVMTVHKAKGLEFDVVFCPFLKKAGMVRFPVKHRTADPGHPAPPVLRFREELDEGEIEALKREDFSEELRILYVAVTRARVHVTVVLPDEMTKKGALPFGNPSPLLWLLLGLWPGFSPDSPEETGEGPLREGVVLTPELVARKAEALSGGMIAVGRCTAPDLPLKRAKEDVSPDSGGDKPNAELSLSGRPGWVSESFTSLVRAVSGAMEETDWERDGREEIPTPPRGGLSRGATTGIMIHELLEKRDERCLPDEWIDLVGERLLAHGFSKEEDLAPTLSMIDCVWSTPLDGASLILGALSPDKRVRELSFSFPMERFSLFGLFDLLKRSGIKVPREWSERTLSLVEHQGFLSGAVDLFFLHEGQAGFVDYKTNDLGPSAEDYSQESMARALVEGGYHLQCLLYTVALHRHLLACIGPTYQYERDFRGGAFLFLRGMLPPRTQGQGIFWIRYPEKTILEVDSFFRGESDGHAFDRGD